LPLPGLGRGVANDVGQRIRPVPFQPATAKYTLAAPKSDKGGKHAKTVLPQKNAKGEKNFNHGCAGMDTDFQISVFCISAFQKVDAAGFQAHNRRHHVSGF
jgi:hypothetical protein